jgi:putative copper resistance protein D
VNAYAIALALDKIGLYAAVVGVLGGVFFQLAFTTISARLERRLQLYVGVCGLIGLAAVALRLLLTAGQLGGGGLAGMADPMMIQFALNGSNGVFFAALAAGFTLALLSFIPGRTIQALPLLGSLPLAGAFVVTGHTAGGWLASAVFFHVIAISGWAGTLLPLIWAMQTEPHEPAAELLQRYSPIAIGIVILLAITGAAMAWALTGGLGVALSHPYVLALMGKLTFVALMLALAARHRYILTPAVAAGQPGARAKVAASIRVEALAALGVLTMTALLTGVPAPTAMQ